MYDYVSSGFEHERLGGCSLHTMVNLCGTLGQGGGGGRCYTVGRLLCILRYYAPKQPGYWSDFQSRSIFSFFTWCLYVYLH